MKISFKLLLCNLFNRIFEKDDLDDHFNLFFKLFDKDKI